jgi:hypothetical protein
MVEKYSATFGRSKNVRPPYRYMTSYTTRIWTKLRVARRATSTPSPFVVVELLAGTDDGSELNLSPRVPFEFLSRGAH